MQRMHGVGRKSSGKIAGRAERRLNSRDDVVVVVAGARVHLAKLLLTRGEWLPLRGMLSRSTYFPVTIHFRGAARARARASSRKTDTAAVFHGVSDDLY